MWRLTVTYECFMQVKHKYLYESKEASILWSRHEETRELPRERDNARNNARCTQVRKTTHGLVGQHQDVSRTPVEELIMRPWCGQPSDRGWLKNRTDVSLSISQLMYIYYVMS